MATVSFDRRAIQECAHEAALALLDAAGERLSVEDRRELYRLAFELVQDTLEECLARPRRERGSLPGDPPEAS